MSGVQQTSIDAYHDIRPQLGKRQAQVYYAIKSLGCPTNLELATYMKMAINQVTPRVHELRKMGVVVQCETRQCSISHRTAMSWRVK